MNRSHASYSPLFALLLTPCPLLTQGAPTVRVSTTNTGVAAGSGAPALSPDGRYVAFASASAQIVAGDTNSNWDVFLHDRITGTVEIASRASNGAQGHPLAIPALWEMDVALACSRDARFVAFTSSAPDLVPGDTNGAIDVFVRDRASGMTVLASDAPGGVPGDDAAAYLFVSSGLGGTFYLYYPSPIAITPDGRFVAFASSATNLVAGDTNLRQDVFVRDLQTGQTERVSGSSGGAQGDSDSFAPALSADGRFVAFQGTATNLVAGDANQKGDVFVRDRLLGTTEIVSVSSAGTQGLDHSSWYVFYPPPTCHDCIPSLHFLHTAISADSRFVAFSSLASNLDAPPASSGPFVYLRDRVAGMTRNVLPLANGGSDTPNLSVDGRFLALTSRATNLGPIDTNAGTDVYRLDLASNSVGLESVDATGAQGSGDASSVALAEDGMQIAFATDADLAPGGPFAPQMNAYTRNAPAYSFAEDCEGTLATCPCGNVGASDRGCANSVEPRGARLFATGVPSVSADTLVLSATGQPANTSTLFVQAATSNSSAAATPLGDGVLCLTGTLVRLRARPAQFGRAQLGLAGDSRVSQLGAIPPLGATVHYQAFYRNAANYCTTSTQNASNSVVVVWTP